MTPRRRPERRSRKWLESSPEKMKYIFTNDIIRKLLPIVYYIQDDQIQIRLSLLRKGCQTFAIRVIFGQSSKKLVTPNY